MCGTLVALQVGSLAERGSASFTLEWPFPSVNSLVVENFCSAGKSFSAGTAHKRLVASVDNSVHLQVSGTCKTFSTSLAKVILKFLFYFSPGCIKIAYLLMSNFTTKQQTLNYVGQ